jgi:hypothetical protein
MMSMWMSFRTTTLRSAYPVDSYTMLPKMAPVSVDDTLMFALRHPHRFCDFHPIKCAASQTTSACCAQVNKSKGQAVAKKDNGHAACKMPFSLPDMTLASHQSAGPVQARCINSCCRILVLKGGPCLFIAQPSAAVAAGTPT